MRPVVLPPPVMGGNPFSFFSSCIISAPKFKPPLVWDRIFHVVTAYEWIWLLKRTRADGSVGRLDRFLVFGVLRQYHSARGTRQLFSTHSLHYSYNITASSLLSTSLYSQTSAAGAAAALLSTPRSAAPASRLGFSRFTWHCIFVR